MKLELIPLEVSDVEASKAFYENQAGFRLDHDVEPGNGMRVVQMTPPGSSCSIAFGTGMGEGTRGRNLHLVVDDIVAMRESLIARGTEMSDISDMGGVKYSWFSDPDGNSWALQEIPAEMRPKPKS